MPKSVNEILQIDDLRLDLAARRVFRNEEEIELGRLTFDLFAVLARAAPAALSTDDIVAQVWKAESVSDETVQQRVSLLRRSLGKDSDREYVQTVRGFGYRLATEPRRLEARSSSSSPTAPGEPHAARADESRRTARWSRIVLAALGILALLMVLALLAMVTRQIKRWSPQLSLHELALPTGVGPIRPPCRRQAARPHGGFRSGRGSEGFDPRHVLAGSGAQPDQPTGGSLAPTNT